jgi:hypothetical protein
MTRTEKQSAAAKAATRLMIGNLPYSTTRSDFTAAFEPHADLLDVYLSPPKAPSRNNGGWGIIAVDEQSARHILDQTLRVGDRVARITRARAKTE